MPHQPSNQEKPVAGFAVALWILVFVFCLRVLGQLIQQVSPLPWLPGLEQWQGSALPYWLLLTIQWAIIAVMVMSVRRCTSGNLVRRPAQGKWLLFLGTIYFVVMAGRLVIGWTLPSAGPWFHKPIPAIFHLVLASFILLLGAHHTNRIARAVTHVDRNVDET
ncbi:MAG TPA: hypothetical protein VN418_07890 [Gammaproteobacteria bacterium]|nr:hypothetical protein [Gammaproteobacteria bacterium]